MSLEFSANILSRFKQGHEFKNVFPLACSLVSPSLVAQVVFRKHTPSLPALLCSHRS